MVCLCVQGRRVSVQGCWCVGMYVCVQRKRTQDLDTKRESLHDTHLSARNKRLLRWTEGMTSVFSSNPHTSIILIWTRPSHVEFRVVPLGFWICLQIAGVRLV